MPISSETLKRYAVCILGLFFSAQGVAITKLGALGVSPISSVANVMSLRLPALSLGNWLIIWNCVLILGQILILRRKFQPIQLLQIPLSFLFGYFTDFGMWAFSWASPELYPLRLVNICCGTIILGFGIALCVISNAVMNSGEAFVKALSGGKAAVKHCDSISKTGSKAANGLRSQCDLRYQNNCSFTLFQAILYAA